MPGQGWIMVNVPEYAWINCFDYARVINMLRYSYNHIIIIVTSIRNIRNIIINMRYILEIFSVQFVYPGALLPFYLFLTRVGT